MPKNGITSPAATTSAERLTLGEAHVRTAFAETANYNLCGGCGNGLSGCFEVETSWGGQCSGYTCFEDA